MKPKFKKGQFVKATLPHYGEVSGEVINVIALSEKLPTYEVYFDLLPEGKTLFLVEEDLKKVSLNFDTVLYIIMALSTLAMILQCLK